MQKKKEMNLKLVNLSTSWINDNDQFLDNYFDWCNKYHSGEITNMDFEATIRMFKLTQKVKQKNNYFKSNTWREEVSKYREKFKPITKEYQIVNSLLEQ